MTVLALLLIEQKTENKIPNRIVRSQPTELEKFLHTMALRESNNTSHVVNQYGMMGKYQFAKPTITMLGFNVSEREFLSNPTLQDSVMIANMKLNNKELTNIIKRYDGKTVKGVKVTRAGILAAAHLAGPANVMGYFASNDLEGRTDANGTSIRMYMQLFSKYNIGDL